ncbi:Toll-like receptor 7, partial [Lamprotornis superbus]
RSGPENEVKGNEDVIHPGRVSGLFQNLICQTWKHKGHGAWFPKTLPCDVEPSEGAVTVDCTDRRLTEVPRGIPANTTNLTLSINHIPHIYPTTFNHLENLEEIDFRCNCVPVKLGPKDHVCTSHLKIENGSFAALTRLRSLYLDANQLAEIPRGLPATLTLLSLEANSIFSIQEASFSELGNIEVLYLGQNCYYRNPCNVSFEIEKTAFLGLKKLTILSLKSNNLTQIPPNLSSTLKELYIYNNMIQEIQEQDLSGLPNLDILDLRMESQSLRILEFRGNRLDVLWMDGNARYLSFFKNLTNLEELDISFNSLRFLPHSVFEEMPPSLRILNLTNNQLESFIWGNLPSLRNLVTLDLSNNLLATVPRELSNCTSSLQKLMLRNNRIQRLTKYFLRGAFELRYLDLSSNKIEIIKRSSFPENVINNLKMLLLHGNPFKCNCEAVWFVWWINRTQVTIPLLATDVTCAGPGAHKGRSVVFLDLYTCELDTSYLILYALSASAVLGLMVFTVMSHLYFWDVWYSYHYCTAKLKGYRRLSSPDACYDAFVAYDSEDPAVNEWVLQELVERLENHKARQFNLCLEGRDWLPGQPVFDNLSQSIQLSKKTIFVLTNSLTGLGKLYLSNKLHKRVELRKPECISHKQGKENRVKQIGVGEEHLLLEVPLAFSLAQFLAHTMFISVLEVLMNCRRKLHFIHHISKRKGAQL